MGLIVARCAQKTSFKKVLSAYQPPKDIYVPTPIGTFPFMSRSPFSFSDDVTLSLRFTLSSSVLLIFTSWLWRSIRELCFQSNDFTLTLNVLSDKLMDCLSLGFIFQFRHILKLGLHQISNEFASLFIFLM